MGCSYTGSAGGAIVIDTPNCANKLAGMAIIRTANNRKREVRILNHLARSSFDCPVKRCCCGLRGVRAMVVTQRFHEEDCRVCAIRLTFQKRVRKKSARAQRQMDSRRRWLSSLCSRRYSVTLITRFTPG